MVKKSNEKINTGFLAEQKKPKRIESFSVFVRGNFFIPHARKFWIKPSTNYLTDYLKNNPVDAVISTGPPHSMHLIAMGLKKNFPALPWIADFRDLHVDPVRKDLILIGLQRYFNKKILKVSNIRY